MENICQRFFTYFVIFNTFFIKKCCKMPKKSAETVLFCHGAAVTNS